MKFLFPSFWRHLRRRGESGQSVIVLAIGFIALLGFVGITTDVSLMFVRYAQLSRAVDSAAIAAANQMRQDRSLATVGLAARQFIEFHGLDPETVWVDTCLTVTTQGIGDPDYEELCTEDQAKLVRVKAYIKQPTVFMRILGIPEFELLASAVSQTAALDVVIIMDVSESMLSDTTVEDWAKTEEIGAIDTDPTVINWGVIYRPPVPAEIIQTLYAADIAANPSLDVATLEDRLWYDFVNGTNGAKTNNLLKYPQIEVNNRLSYFEDGTAVGAITAPRETAYRVEADDDYFAAQYGTAFHPREACRVRFYPFANNRNPNGYLGYLNEGTGNFVTLTNLYNEIGGGMTWPTGRRFDAFVPTYNFYGCCNDPDGDTTFDDLNCQPFKQARDATFKFIERIDFIRGDRVAYVTFDRAAFLINPYGYNDAAAKAAGNESQRSGTPMIDSYGAAYDTLRYLIGVRAEPNFYVFDPGATPGLHSKWSGFAAGRTSTGASIPIDYGRLGYNPQDGKIPESYNYPVFDNCPFGNASVGSGTRSLFPNALSNVALPNGLPTPLGRTQDGRDINWENFMDGDKELIAISSRNQLPGNRAGYDITMSYEYWASCNNGNVGAALREGNNALLNPITSRRFGTVWVMVLLSDGAAGGTDPVRRGGAKLVKTDPYTENPTGSGIYGIAGDYGAFGLCPMGLPTQPGELVTTDNDTASGSARFPYCSDETPRTRYTCDFRPLKLRENPNAMHDNDYKTNLTEAENQAAGNIYDVDLQNCNPLYDVDDYARDWADVIGLSDLQTNEELLLPTIFTIGFGLGFNNIYADPNNPATLLIQDATKPVSHPDNHILAQANATQLCERNIANCLGEQLLRYIADVGDNNRIDDDYWQDWISERLVDEEPLLQGYLRNDANYSEGEFGVRGPCQTNEDGDSPPEGYYFNPLSVTGRTQADLNRQWGALGPNRSCGNYYYAPGGPELQFVFDEIASRMFTRLSR
jgi:hypothetical protein